MRRREKKNGGEYLDHREGHEHELDALFFFIQHIKHGEMVLRPSCW